MSPYLTFHSYAVSCELYSFRIVVPKEHRYLHAVGRAREDTDQRSWDLSRARLASVNVPLTLSMDFDMSLMAARFCSYAAFSMFTQLSPYGLTVARTHSSAYGEAWITLLVRTADDCRQRSAPWRGQPGSEQQRSLAA